MSSRATCLLNWDWCTRHLHCDSSALPQNEGSRIVSGFCCIEWIQKSLSMPLYSRSSSPSSSSSMQDCMAAKRRRARGMGAHRRRTGGERRGVSERERWVGPKRMTTINGLSMPPCQRGLTGGVGLS